MSDCHAITPNRGGMMTVYTRLTNGRFDRQELDVTPRRALSDMRVLREYLERLARQFWTGPNGRDWAIAQAPAGTLVPIYARHRKTGDTITVE